MGPTRKSRSNKRYSYINEVSKSRDGDSGSKKGQRKKKLSNMLGNEWSEEELERFYTAYRKHGKDWKKVATAVRNKSSDMVEALYTMNRAYLSLPEGTASVVGLIAMMTDYYSNLARSDSEQGSQEGVGTSRKPKKRGATKAQTSKASGSQSILGTSAPYDCLPFLKKKRSGGTRPRAVGKRTPRFPVAHSFEDVNGEKYFSPSRLALRLKRDSDDDEVAHEILALASATQRAGSPESSQTPNKRRIGDIISPITNAKRMHAELEMSGEMDDDNLEESIEADNRGYSRRYTMESRGVGPSAGRGRKSYGKKGDFDDDESSYLDDIREACSGTEEGLVGRRKFDDENNDSKVLRSRKRSKKALFRKDEVSALDALQTLANMSLMMPDDEIDQSVQCKDEEDHVDESGLPEPLPTNQKKERRKTSGVRVKGNQSLKLSRTSKASDELKQESQQPANKVSRKKQKTIPSRIQKSDTQLNESQEVEVKDVPKEPVVKSKRSAQNAVPKASLADLRREANETAMSALQLPMSNQLNFAAKRIKRKIDLEKPQKIDDIKLSDDRLLALKEKVSNCLLNPRLRRLCIFEWFYSAIDYPWFAKREFVEYLYHVGLGHVPRLTRVEWGVIRSSLGKPRRFSEQFLKEEKEKLNQYRDSVRAHYTELRSGTREGLPTDLAKPLSVAQRVIAIHPSTREIHDGSVLTVDHDKCRIQFDRPELGVEFVLDIDCMPLNPVENMPTAMSGYSSVVNKLFENLNDLRMNVQQQVATKDQRLEGLLKSSIQNPSIPSPTNYMLSNLLKQVTPAIGDAQTKSVAKETSVNQQTVNSVMSVTLGRNQAVEQNTSKEEDVQAIAAFTRALDKKQAILEELKRMHDDVSEDKPDGLSALKESEPFKKIYAAVLTQLSESNVQLESALARVRQRNTYPGLCPPPWAKSTCSQVDSVGMLTSSADRSAIKSQESGHVTEIVESSRTKANSMVDAAIRAMKSLKLGGNNFEKIEEAIDYVNDRVPLDDSQTRVPLRSSTNGDSNGSLSVLTNDSKNELTTTNEIPIPSELISNCVATLFMIQKCTERQFPPADVAAILDSAVTNLKPSCSQNLPIYDEIQKCMGIIRNQIMALVPT